MKGLGSLFGRKVSADTLLDTALRHCAAGEWTEAEALYSQCVEANAAHDAIRDLRARIDSGREAAAARERELARSALGRGDVEAALGHYRNAVDALPGDESAHFDLGNALALAGDNEGAAHHLREAIRLNPHFAAAYCNLALTLHELGSTGEARQMISTALRLDPTNPDYALNLRVISSSPVPLWHFSMMNDAQRNAAYESAIRAVVKPGDQVLEIGTGSGLLAMMAARAGAQHVYTCEVGSPGTELEFAL